MELAHGLMIGGVLLVVIGSIGVALQTRLAITGPVSKSQDKDNGGQVEILPKFLPHKAGGES
jgi:hypothetical protein